VKRTPIEPAHPQLSGARRCAPLGMARSGWYYTPAAERAEDLALMRRLDEQYTQTPVYGSRRMTAWLRQEGYAVDHRRAGRLLRLLGVEARYPKPRLSVPGAAEKRHPYLLRGRAITAANDVWSSDITYIRLRRGFLYLVAVLDWYSVAVLDWYSRYVLAWELSHTLDAGCCLAALEAALRQGQPAIFNADQGVQFTRAAYTSRLEAAGIQSSWDGRGRALDNVFVERLWRSVKWGARSSGRRSISRIIRRWPRR
jgi:putative transposase